MESIKDIKVDLEELKKFKAQNAKERLEFIDWWVDYMKKNKDEKWSEQQNVVIDSQIDQSLYFGIIFLIKKEGFNLTWGFVWDTFLLDDK